MHPIISLELFHQIFKIPSYEFFAALAALSGSTAAVFLLRKAKLRTWQSLILILLSGICFLTGARIWNFAVNYQAYGKHFPVWSVKFAGFSIYGGILGALAVLFPYAKRIGKNPAEVLDALVLPAGMAFAIARIGCYLNGCCSGKITHSLLGVCFPQKPGSVSSLFGNALPLIGSARVAVYPTQLFEMGLALIGLIYPLWLYFRERLPAGVCFLLYFLWACVMRLLVLPFRELSYPQVVVKGIYPLVYASLIALTTFLLIKKQRSKKIRPPSKYV